MCVCADMFHRTVAAAEGEFVESGFAKIARKLQQPVKYDRYPCSCVLVKPSGH